MERNFGGIIWTNHSLERIGQRGLTQKMAYEAFQFPEFTEGGKQPGSFQYSRNYGSSKVTVVAKQNERREWIVLSCWIDPPLVGYSDWASGVWKQKYNKSSPWKKWWLEIKRQFGL